jgi:hypothetical protein
VNNFDIQKMKKFPRSLSLLGLGTLSLLLFSCGESQTESLDAPAIEPKPADSAEPAAPATSSDSDSADNGEFSLDDLMTSLAPGDGALEGDLGSLNKEQRQTLQSAVEKAAGEIDFSLLSTVIGSKISEENLGGAKALSSLKALTPEEAEALGIDLEKIRNGSSSVTVRTQVLSIGGDSDGSVESKTPINPATDVTVLSTEPIGDPELSKRIQQHLQSGDSDALATELKSLLQDSIDGAAIQQALEPAPAESK